MKSVPIVGRTELCDDDISESRFERSGGGGLSSGCSGASLLETAALEKRQRGKRAREREGCACACASASPCAS
jgi:acetyl-CoA acetyltransferase